MRNLKWILLSFSFSIIIYSCKKDNDDNTTNTADYDSEMVTSWMELMLTMTKETPGFSPPVAARMFGYTGVALYESVRPGMPDYRTLAGQINGLDAGSVPDIEAEQEYNWAIVANAAIATVLSDCLVGAKAENENLISAQENQWLVSLSQNTAQDVITRSVAYGEAVGTAISLYAASDGQSQCYQSNFPDTYTPPQGDGLWVPTPPAFQRALQPYWGDVRPFVTANVEGNLPAAPPVYSTDITSAFYLEAIEVNEAVVNLTAEEEMIAKYWSDDPGTTATPPGHSVAILMQVLEMEEANLAVAAEAFAKLGMAVHDAFISCWKAKYTYNLVRPVTYIQENINVSFTPILNTPPFPEYTSGHSVQSGAAAQVLTDLFGNDYAFTDRTHENRTDIDGSPRNFSSFFDFADEAAISRLYGGIHYRAAIELGVDQGKVIGTNIANLQFHN